MAVFGSQPLNPTPFQKAVKSSLQRRPFILFGLPFLGLVVFSSYALEKFTKTRYDYHNTKVQSVSKEEQLKMDKNRKRVDLKEEYYVSFIQFRPNRIDEILGLDSDYKDSTLRKRWTMNGKTFVCLDPRACQNGARTRRSTRTSSRICARCLNRYHQTHHRRNAWSRIGLATSSECNLINGNISTVISSPTAVEVCETPYRPDNGQRFNKAF
jgi:hypothetical protein